MKTIIYLIKHAEKYKRNYEEYKVAEDETKKDEKSLLSVNGEKKAALFAKCQEFKNIENIYSSHYVRCTSTAKYLSEELDIPIRVDSRLKEMNYGTVDSDKKRLLILNIEQDFDYRNPSGESLNDVRKRAFKAFDDIFNWQYGKISAIFTHTAVITALLSEFCEVGYSLDNRLIFNFGDKSIPSNFASLDVIKLTFEDRKIENVEKLELNI